MNETRSPEESQARQFTELFTANYGPVLAYVRRRVSADLAQDVVADTFLAAWRNIHELTPDPLPWLYRAAHFAVANQRRTLARRSRLDERAQLGAASVTEPDHSDQVTADMELAAAFRVLSEADREVLRLAAWEGLSAEEIGVVIGCSAVAAKARLRRARQRLSGLSRVGGPKATGEAQTWQQVGTTTYAQSWHHGKLGYGITYGPNAPFEGWPTPTGTTWYPYLASLPAQPAALRKIILANNHDDPTAAFTAIESLFGNFPLSAQFQAELYAVLISLPGVGFTGHAVDPAGRPGIGLYLVHDGLLEGIIVNPRTYVYMGGLTIAVQGHPSYGALLAHPVKGTVVDCIAILNSGFVSQVGQIP